MDELWIAMTIAIATLCLFIWNKLQVEVVGLLVMTALILTGLVSLEEGVSGFANEAMLTVAAMFVLSAGLVRTGAVDLLARWLAAAAKGSEKRLLAASILMVIPLSAVVNNTPVVAVMIPVVLGICRQINSAPSRLLMPISFASQMGGTLTLIGTSTNLLVAGMAVQLGLPAFGLFDITGPAMVLLVVGVLYLATAGWWLCPIRSAGTDLVQSYELRDYLATLVVPEGSKLAGRTLGQLQFQDRFGLEVLIIERNGRRRRSPGPDAPLQLGDRLLVEGKAKEIARIQDEQGLELLTEGGDFSAYQRSLRKKDDGKDQEGDEAEEEWQWAELIVPPRSRFIGRTLAHVALRGRYGTTVLGLQRAGASLLPRLAQTKLNQGDLLLVQARPSALMKIHEGRDLALLGPLDVPVTRNGRRTLAVVILMSVVALSAFGVMPILLSALIGCCAMFVTGCVTTEEAYEEVDWSVLVLIGSMIPLGLAMQRTGAAAWIADVMLSVTGPFGPVVALAGFYLMTSLLTELISNNAAAVVLTPIAVAAGTALGVSPLPFVMAVMLAASNSFMTPIGYQTNTFVFGPGGYRFTDFLKVGGPLNMLLVVVAAVAIPWFFPF